MTSIKEESSTPNISRRDFLSRAGAAALLTTLGASLLALLRFLSFTPPDESTRITLDTPDAYPSGAFISVADGRVFIGRDDRGLYAIVAACTHLGCLVESQTDGFQCPCHGSRFDNEGAVTQGPAVRPLERAALTTNVDGRVVLDVTHRVDARRRLSVPDRQ